MNNTTEVMAGQDLMMASKDPNPWLILATLYLPTLIYAARVLEMIFSVRQCRQFSLVAPS